MKYYFRIVYILCITGLFAACGETASPPELLPVNVHLHTVQMEQPVYYDVYPATLIPLKEIKIVPQITGYITAISFKDGDYVKKGQVLYTIDTQVYDAQLKNASANVQVKEAELLRAQKDWERYKTLQEENAVAKQQLDNAIAVLESAKQAVAAAKEQMNAMQANVKFTTLYAPFSGNIGISQVRIGTAVFAGQTVLNTLSTIHPIGVDFNVEQNRIVRFMDMKQKTALQKDLFYLHLDTFIYPFSGRLELIDRAVDPQTGTIKIRLSFPNPEGYLKAGMTGTVNLKSDRQKKALLIPYKAVVEQLGEFFVYVFNDSTNRVSQQYIKLGRIVGDKVIVEKGLEEGRKIVVEGMQKLREGSLVQFSNQQRICRNDS